MLLIANLKKFSLRFVMGWSLLGIAALGVAQETPKAQTDKQEKISDAELRAFVKAYVENQRIRQQYEPSLMDNKDPQKGQQLQDRANEELKKSLAKQNLSIENYNRIYNAINSDEQLRERALELVKEERRRA